MKRELEVIMIEQGVEHYRAERSADLINAKFDEKVAEAVNKKLDDAIDVIKDEGGIFDWANESCQEKIVAAIKELKIKNKSEDFKHE